MNEAAVHAIVQRLPRELSNFARNKKLLYELPVGEILAGFFFEDSIVSKTTFRLYALVLPLYVPHDVLSLRFAMRLVSPMNTETWDLHTNSPESIIKVLRTQGLGFISRLHTPRDFVANSAQVIANLKEPYFLQALSYSLLVMNRVQEANSIFRDLTQIRPDSPAWRLAIADRSRLLMKCIEERTIDEARQYLTRWRSESLRALNLR